MLQQQLDAFNISIAGSGNQRSSATRCTAALFGWPQKQLHVRIGTLFQQHTHNGEAVGFVEGFVRLLRVGSAAAYRSQQRRLTVDIPLLYISTGFDQFFRDVPVTVECGQRQWCHTFGIRQVEINFVFHQYVDALNAVFAYRVQQRCQTAGIQALGAAFFGKVATVITIDGLGVDVGAFFKQVIHHRRMATGRGPHQRTLLAPRLNGIDVGALVHQQFGGGDIAGACHQHQRGLAFRVG